MDTKCTLVSIQPYQKHSKMGSFCFVTSYFRKKKKGEIRESCCSKNIKIGN